MHHSPSLVTQWTNDQSSNEVFLVVQDCDLLSTQPFGNGGMLCRAEGACSEKYLEQDLTLVRCYVCNRMGHLCCAEAPQDLAEPSCYNCGEEGHLGSDCWHDKPTQVDPYGPHAALVSVAGI